MWDQKRVYFDSIKFGWNFPFICCFFFYRKCCVISEGDWCRSFDLVFLTTSCDVLKKLFAIRVCVIWENLDWIAQYFGRNHKERSRVRERGCVDCVCGVSVEVHSMHLKNMTEITFPFQWPKTPCTTSPQATNSHERIFLCYCWRWYRYCHIFIHLQLAIHSHLELFLFLR